MESSGSEIIIGEKVSKPLTNALPRPRVTDRVGELIKSGVGCVHGTAGIGKTTALAQLADEWPGETAWVRLDHGDGDEHRLVALVESALGLSPGSPDPTIDHVIARLESGKPVSTLLVFDDMHSIEGSAAEQAIYRLIRYRPRSVAVLIASRHDCELALRGLVGPVEPMLIDFEDLRFRLWEVDDLMRTHHDMVIAPSDLNLLCRYTDGWAAALRLFSVASRDAGPEHRSRLISGLRKSHGMIHDYLTSEVLSTLETDARDLLVATSVFEEITPDRAKALLGTDDARSLLRAIRLLGLFGDVAETSDTYRCHDLLRTHLLGQLTEKVGDDESLTLQIRAAVVAESEGSWAEAIRYYARGGDFDSVRRILHSSGDVLATGPGSWIEVLPPAMRDQDPFVLLTSARQLVRHGDLDEARVRYRRAVHLLGANDGVTRAARRELRLLDVWLLGETAPMDSWVGNLRDLLQSGASTARRAGTEMVGLDGAVADLLAGNLSAAAVAFREAEETAGGVIGVIAGAARLLVDHLRGGDESCSPVALRRVQQAAKSMDARCVERLVGAMARGGVAAREDDPLSAECRRSNDRLGGALVHFIDGVALIHERRVDPAPFAAADELFASGGYQELALLSRCFGAAAAAATNAQTGDPEPLEVAARRSGGLAHLMALAARAEVAGRDDPALEVQIDRLARRSDLTRLVSLLREAREGSRDDDRLTASVELLGSFRLFVGGEAVTLGLTPLHQEVLAYLAIHAGEWVHKDHLMATFWPDMDDTRARRSLQVAVSKVRLEVEGNGIGMIDRNGPRYALVPAPTTEVDVMVLRDLLATPAMPIDDRADAVERAMSSYGELVEDLGAANWAVDPRRDLRLAVSRAALQVARDLREVGDLDRAALLAEAGVHIDPACDELWHIAIGHAGAARARELQAEYDRVIGSYGGIEVSP